MSYEEFPGKKSEAPIEGGEIESPKNPEVPKQLEVVPDASEKIAKAHQEDAENLATLEADIHKMGVPKTVESVTNTPIEEITDDSRFGTLDDGRDALKEKFGVRIEMIPIEKLSTELKSLDEARLRRVSEGGDNIVNGYTRAIRAELENRNNEDPSAEKKRSAYGAANNLSGTVKDAANSLGSKFSSFAWRALGKLEGEEKPEVKLPAGIGGVMQHFRDAQKEKGE